MNEQLGERSPASDRITEHGLFAGVASIFLAAGWGAATATLLLLGMTVQGDPDYLVFRLTIGFPVGLMAAIPTGLIAGLLVALAGVGVGELALTRFNMSRDAAARIAGIDVAVVGSGIGVAAAAVFAGVNPAMLIPVVSSVAGGWATYRILERIAD